MREYVSNLEIKKHKPNFLTPYVSHPKRGSLKLKKSWKGLTFKLSNSTYKGGFVKRKQKKTKFSSSVIGCYEIPKYLYTHEKSLLTKSPVVNSERHRAKAKETESDISGGIYFLAAKLSFVVLYISSITFCQMRKTLVLTLNAIRFNTAYITLYVYLVVFQQLRPLLFVGRGKKVTFHVKRHWV